MRSCPQTAIRGVPSVATINLLARVLGYGKHVVIAAYIGLTAALDAFHVALTILSVFILSFGDVFDSLGVPRLVRALQDEGEDGFRRHAGITPVSCLSPARPISRSSSSASAVPFILYSWDDPYRAYRVNTPLVAAFLEAIKGEATISELASRFGIHPTMVFGGSAGRPRR